MNFSTTLRLLSCHRLYLGKYASTKILDITKYSYKRNFATLFCYQRKALVPPVTCLCDISRSYAKGKDKKKTDSKGKKKVAINDDELSEIVQTDTMKNQMQKALDVLRDEYIKNVSLRSSAGMIHTIMSYYYLL